MKNIFKAFIPGLVACAIAGVAAFAANNYAATEGSGKTFSCTDVAGVCFPSFVPFDSGGTNMTDTTNHALKVVGIGTASGTAIAGVNGSPVLYEAVSSAPSYTTGQFNWPTTDLAGNTRIVSGTDPCSSSIAKTNVPISMQNTTTVKLVSLSSTKKIYICSLSLIASGATVFSVADGTKTTTECDTAAEAVMGAAVASHGLSLAANGGVTYGSGVATVALTNTASHDLCLFQSGSVDLSGNLTYVQQ